MPQRRGGGRGADGGGDGGVESLLRRGLRELLDRVDRADVGGNGGGGGNGGRGRDDSARSASRGRGAQSSERDGQRGRASGGLGGAAGANRAVQIGDWVCRECQFGPNFSRRRECFRCKRPRSPRGQGSTGNGHRDLSGGPVGAGGLRPLLGNRTDARGATGSACREFDKSPTFRVPGASVAARAAGTGSGAGTWAEVAGRQGTGGPAAPPRDGVAATGTARPEAKGVATCDDDGFRLVTGRGGRKGSAGATGGGTDAPGGERPERPHDTDQTARRRDDDDEVYEDAHDDGDATEAPPTADELRQRWQDEISVVKRLRGLALPEDHPVMRAACTARDEAEQMWRGSKEPAPASVRLGRAQQKLDRAISLQAEARRAICDEEAAHKKRMEALQATMEECTERVRLRREQLGEVQEEVGAGSAQATGARQAQQDAMRKVHDAICGEVGPAIESLVEQLDSNAPAWTTLNGLLATLARSKATLEGAVEQQEQRHPAQYDIAKDERRDHGDVDDEGTDWSESHEVEGNQWGRGDQTMGTGDWWDGPAASWGNASRWTASGHGHWTKANWADQLEEEQSAAREDDGQPPAARRRLDGTGGDLATKEAQGQEQRQPTPQQRAPQQTGSQHGAPGSAAEGTAPGDAEETRRRHQARINRVTEAAVAAGVTPLSKWGEDLQLLDSAQLDEWIAEFMPPTYRG